MDKNTAEGTFSLFLGKYKSRQATVMLTRCSLPTETQTPVTGISKGLPPQNSRVQNAKCYKFQLVHFNKKCTGNFHFA